jgi:sugar O-acyltransferase (sialic acid O-acetyltransferase NeuD family)
VCLAVQRTGFAELEEVVSEKRPLVLIGAGVFAEVAYEYFSAASAHEIVAFAVDREFQTSKTFQGLPVVTTDELATTHPPAEHDVFVAILYSQLNRVRQRRLAALRALGYAPASYISPHAFVSPSARIGEHCFIFENNVIQTKCTIGENVVMWSGNHVGHHSRVGDNVFLSSHVVISGNCDVGDNCFLGVNSTVIDGVKVGQDNWIGPGVVILGDTEPDRVYRPAKEARAEVMSVSAKRFQRVVD